MKTRLFYALWLPQVVAILLALSLTACATRERIVYRDVPTPIPVPCAVSVPPAEPYAADTVSLDANLFELVRAILVDREQRKATEIRLRGAVEACAGSG